LGIVLKILKWLGIGAIFLFLCFYGYMWHLLGTSSITTHGSIDLNTGNATFPTERTRSWSDRSALVDSLVTHWSQREIVPFSVSGKITNPRALIAKLERGRDIDAVNRHIQESVPHAPVGSTGVFAPTGNYNFTLTQLCVLLYRFDDHPELLYPETVDHLVNVLMTEDGGDPKVWTPKVLGLPIKETENHILMTEGSRYLKNQWKRSHGDVDPRYDNEANGLEDYLLEYLAGIERAGYHEFNARPYQGYTATGLLNLEALAGPKMQTAARRVLDRTAWEYALNSLSFRRFPPFRRQPRRSKELDLDGDYLTAIVKVWMSTGGVDNLFVRKGEHHALIASVSSYRPPDVVAEWIVAKPDPYFIQMGHGWDASCEIYSGGPGYLITAGGVANDRFKQSVARPTTLILDDGAMDLKELLHVAGPGNRFREWNNTGVHRNFAVAAGSVSIPDGWTPETQDAQWQIFRRQGINIAVHSRDSLGLFCLFHEGDPDSLLASLRTANPDVSRLETQFNWPVGTKLTYDVRAPKDRWVIETVDGESLGREHGSWSLMFGDVPGWTRSE
jgi:hypothetical protein